jgi:hypothetical protein
MSTTGSGLTVTSVLLRDTVISSLATMSFHIYYLQFVRETEVMVHV